MNFDIKEVDCEFFGDGTTVRAIARDTAGTSVIVTLSKNLFNNDPGVSPRTLLVNALEKKYGQIMDGKGVYETMRSFKGTRVGSAKVKALK